LKILEQQDYLAMREGAEVLEVDHYGEKVLRLVDGTILKLFRRRRRLISSAALFPYARRFANNAATLARLGVPVPQVIEVLRIPSAARDAVHYAPLAGKTLREMIRAGLPPERERELKAAFTRFVIGLHDNGVYFRSLHLGNVVCTPDGQLGLIDFADLRIHPWGLGKYLRARNIRRMQEMEEEAGWLDTEAIINARPPASGVAN
jgi:tRNA A-37 threonylcarbamoyl transferase component Bud32